MIGNKKKILIIEDDRTMIMIITKILEQYGYQISSVQDGDVALSAIMEQKPDLVMLDINMPKVNGFTVLNCIRGLGGKRGYPCSVVVMTSQEGLTEIATTYDVAHVMKKPFEPKELLRVVQQVV